MQCTCYISQCAEVPLTVYTFTDMGKGWASCTAPSLTMPVLQ